MQKRLLSFIIFILSVSVGHGQDTLWSCKIKKPITLQPLLEISRYYIGTETGSLYCIDVETGRVLWETKMEVKKPNKKNQKEVNTKVPKGKTKVSSSKNQIKNGFLSMFVSNPNYIFGCNVDDNVYAFNKDNGVKIWEYKANFDQDKFAQILTYDNMIIFKTEDSLIIALNQDSGNEVWKYKCSSKVGNLTLREDEIHFPNSEFNIISINAKNGKEESKLGMQGLSFNYDKGVNVIDNNYFMLNDSGNVSAISSRKKKELWNQDFKIKNLYEDDERLVAIKDSTLFGIKPKTGAIIWNVEGNFSDKTLPVLRNGKIYFHSSSKNKIMIINTKTGEYMRSYLVKGSSKVSPAVNEKLIIVCLEEKLIAIKND
jgi:outer membrane protein assembly factor BamB